MINAQQKTISILEEHGPSTVETIAAAAGLSKSSIWYSLKALKEQSRIEQVGKLKTTVGRPKGVYALKKEPKESVTHETFEEGLLEEIKALLKMTFVSTLLIAALIILL